MSSVSGLSEQHRARARTEVAQACRLMLDHAQACHYSQGATRWDGIGHKLLAKKGQYPTKTACSGAAEWALWNGLYVPFGIKSVMGDLGWGSNWTGGQIRHGKQVHHQENREVADFLFYGPLPDAEHVTVYLGGGMVFSNGSEAGPFFERWDYRDDYLMTRRYI